jgi:hypothetical protein
VRAEEGADFVVVVAKANGKEAIRLFADSPSWLTLPKSFIDKECLAAPRSDPQQVTGSSAWRGN